MDLGNRLAQIEAELKLSQERHTATQSTLEALLSAMEQLKSSSQPPPPPPPKPPGPTTAKPDPTVRKPPKLSPPPEFDGDRTKGRAFITACLLYIEAHGGFQTDTQKIMWVFSYMTKGDAAAWATMRTEQIMGSNSDWGSWSGFLNEFRERFTVLDAAALARSRLNTDAYYMKNRTLDEYTDEFMRLVYESGYSDNIVKVERFRAGLKPSIATRIGTSHPRPGADDFNGWVEHARILYKNDVETAAFHSRIAALKSTTPFRPTAPPRITPSSFSTAPTLPSTPPSKPLPMGVPMDVDAAKRAKTSQQVAKCYCCGSTTHLVRDCPQRFDIRLMSQDEVQEYLQQQAFAQDDAELHAAQADEGVESTEQGFGTSNE
ncbi:hypothetical protein MPER_13027 [Moniliophthora perniciosa FA553]|nr:hypothetical protein MPER_13027 [Moniliophthora perniciosa FA553]